MKVLIVTTVMFRFNGVTTMIMNYYRNMNNFDIQFDFVVPNKISEELRGELEKNNSKIIQLNRKKNPFRYMSELTSLIKRESYDVVHVHGNSCTVAIDLFAAKLAGCRKRIAHSHSSVCSHLIIHKMLRPLFESCCTGRLACSEIAGKWMFGRKKFEVIPNGIDIGAYQYSVEECVKVKKELNIKDKFVIGHVGLMNEQKNHEKLLSVFSELKKEKPDVHLLCVTGDEKTPKHLESLMEEYGILDDVTVLHQRSDVNSLLQAMDVFVFPSKYEGFGIALLEAQAAGLPCVVSNQVPDEVNLIGQMRYVSLDALDGEWVNNINLVYAEGKERIECNKMLLNGMYDIKCAVNRLAQIYDAGKI